MQEIKYFMCIYMYELEKILLEQKEDLLKVSFQSDEANTDRPLKEYLKKFIEENFSSIPEETAVTLLQFEETPYTDISTLKQIRVKKVLLKEDISDEIKEIIKSSKESIYTNPDLYLELELNDDTYYESIELKSTKNDSIPGSSIQQLTAEEWVIFIRHSENSINISTGQYIHAINSRIQFPDRSPRPQVSFDEINTWNQNNRLLDLNTLHYKKDDADINKRLLIKDWQKVLAERWLEILFNDSRTKKKEPWFNNNLREFILLFLEKYELLNDNQKKEFKEKIKSLISTNTE